MDALDKKKRRYKNDRQKLVKINTEKCTVDLSIGRVFLTQPVKRKETHFTLWDFI